MLGLPCEPTCVQLMYDSAGRFIESNLLSHLTATKKSVTRVASILLPSILFSDGIMFVVYDMQVV